MKRYGIVAHERPQFRNETLYSRMLRSISDTDTSAFLFRIAVAVVFIPRLPAPIHPPF
jgi:hypothetical protein